MVHGSKNCGYWASWGPTIVLFTKKYKILNPVTLARIQVCYVGLCVLWVVCGSSKATLRCSTSICDGIIPFNAFSDVRCPATGMEHIFKICIATLNWIHLWRSWLSSFWLARFDNFVDESFDKGLEVEREIGEQQCGQSAANNSWKIILQTKAYYIETNHVLLEVLVQCGHLIKMQRTQGNSENLFMKQVDLQRDAT